MAARGPRSLVVAAWLVLALLAAHDVTHVLDEGLETPLGQVAYVAIPQWLFLAVAMTVIVRGDPARSRIAALLVGVSVALGFAAIHLLPFSPAAYWDLRPSSLSWVLAWMPAVAGLLLFGIAWPRRSIGASWRHGSQGPDQEGRPRRGRASHHDPPVRRQGEGLERR